jgi:hypothetical protein
MSLFIIGSCSKITRNIIVQLSKNNQYQHITLGDLLPTYEFHERYYKLRKELADHKFNTTVQLDKLI